MKKIYGRNGGLKEEKVVDVYKLDEYLPERRPE